MSEFPTNMKVHPKVESFFDPQTYTISHIVMDPGSTSCAVIDSVMDINYAAGRISYEHADEIIAYIQKHNLKLDWLIETHVHADHLSAAPYIQSKLGGRIGIGDQITVVQETFGKVLMKAPNSSATDRNLMRCSRTAIPTRSGGCPRLRSTLRGIRRRAWCM